jgi:predicted Fe-Mo cluster-binding NifX family protein
MKIAAITEDGQTISQHFGRAPYYMVLTIDNGQIISRQMREKLGHSQFSHEPHQAGEASQPHGFDPVSQDRHVRMVQAVLDCEAIICRGMGRGAYESMKGHGIKPIVTDFELIDDAVKAYLDGSIEDHVDRLH